MLLSSRLRLVALGLALAWVAVCGRAETTPTRPTALLFLLSDQHSAYAHTAPVLARIDAWRAAYPKVPAAILINGDIFEVGNPVARRSNGEIDLAMVEAFAARLPTVVNIGNHDCEFAPLDVSIAQLRAARATVLTNLVDAASGAPYAPTSTLVPLGPVTLAVVGLATPDWSTYPAAVRPFLAGSSPLAWWRAQPEPVFPSGTVPVVLSHAGVVADRELLPVLPRNTLLLGGHNHLCFVHHEPNSGVVVVHSGCWNEVLSIARLDRSGDGTLRWTVTQERIRAHDPADPDLPRLVAALHTRHLTPEDQTIVGRSPVALNPADAARLAVAAVRRATGATAALIGNTTFGAGLPAGAVSQIEFDAWVRFDGTVCTAEVDGRQLAALLAAANPGADTPFTARQGEFLYADGPDPRRLEPDQRYLIATNDWGARHSGRYFGLPDLVWTPQPALKLKALARSALDAAPSAPLTASLVL